MSAPLGRYSTPDASVPPQLHEVRLLNLPVRVLAESRERHDELLREFSLLALSDVPPRGDAPADLVQLTEILGMQYGGAAARPDAEVDAALARGDATVDVTYQVPGHAATDVSRIEELMDAADEFCRSQQLLTLARNDLQRRFGRWYLDEFRRQIAGEPPRPWSGPLDPA